MVSNLFVNKNLLAQCHTSVFGMLQGQSRVVVTETTWSTEPKIFTI